MISFDGRINGLPVTSIKFKFGNSPSCGGKYLKLLSLIDTTFNVYTQDNDSGNVSSLFDAKSNISRHGNFSKSHVGCRKSNFGASQDISNVK